MSKKAKHVNGLVIAGAITSGSGFLFAIWPIFGLLLAQLPGLESFGIVMWFAFFTLPVGALVLLIGFVLLVIGLINNQTKTKRALKQTVNPIATDDLPVFRPLSPLTRLGKDEDNPGEAGVPAKPRR